MTQNKIMVKYVGDYKIIFRCPGFFGPLNIGDEILVPENFYNLELKKHKSWELVKEKAPAKKPEIDLSENVILNADVK